jgi:hypothetical protein
MRLERADDDGEEDDDGEDEEEDEDSEDNEDEQDSDDGSVEDEDAQEEQDEDDEDDASEEDDDGNGECTCVWRVLIDRGRGPVRGGDGRLLAIKKGVRADGAIRSMFLLF